MSTTEAAPITIHDSKIENPADSHRHTGDRDCGPCHPRPTERGSGQVAGQGNKKGSDDGVPITASEQCKRRGEKTDGCRPSMPERRNCLRWRPCGRLLFRRHESDSSRGCAKDQTGVAIWPVARPLAVQLLFRLTQTSVFEHARQPMTIDWARSGLAGGIRIAERRGMSAHPPAPQATSDRHGRAVVLGGGMAGMLAARVLADTFEQVTIIERHDSPR